MRVAKAVMFPDSLWLDDGEKAEWSCYATSNS